MTETETQALWGPGEVCRALGVSRATLGRWRSGDFPAPVAELSIGPVWLAADVQGWAETRTRERRAQADRRAHSIVLYRQTGNVSETARQVGVSRETVARWLVDAGEPLPRD